MARSLWKGFISFGLVSIPVELYPAEQKKGSVAFSMLDKRDMSPVGYKRYSKRSGNEVTMDDIVKGYEYEKDQYVVLSTDDFKIANVKASQTVDIKSFVPASAVPLQYFETPYYLAPGKRGEKVYALLRETLRSTGRIAIAQVVIRTTQHLAAVVVDGPSLLMITLRYANELRDAEGIEFPPESLKDAGVTPKEIELAKRLIEDMSEDWNPAEFKDTYHDDLMKRIEEKIARGETSLITKADTLEPEPSSAQVIDLTELLRMSLSGKKASNDDRAEEPRKAAKGARPATRTSARVAEPAQVEKPVDKPAGKRKRA